MESLYELNYNNDKIFITKYLSESNKIFNQRLLFIKKLEKNNINITEIEKLSLLWHYIKFKNCKYSKEINEYILYYDKL